MAAKILLISSTAWPSVARLAGGFARAGAVVEALAPSGAAILASRYLSRWHRYQPLYPQRSLERAVHAAVADLIVCCDDRMVAQLLALYRRTRAQGLRDSGVVRLIETSLGNPLVYDHLIARDAFIADARALGIRTPRSMPVAAAGDVDRAVAELGLPLVLKADGSWGGDGVRVAHTPVEAHAAFTRLAHLPSRWRAVARAIKRRDAHFLAGAVTREAARISAQSFVAGHNAATAIACWQGEVIGEIDYDVLVAEGALGPPNVIRRVECPEMRDASRKIARRYGLSGMLGLDFIRDADGRAHLIEINPRATQGGSLAFGTGADLPAALAQRLAPGSTIRPAIALDVVALFPRQWLRDPLSPYFLTAHHDVPWDDPGVLFASLGLTPGRRVPGLRLPGRPASPPLPSPGPPAGEPVPPPMAGPALTSRH
jgi:hypothetical protein